MTTWSEHDLTTEENVIHFHRMGQRANPPVVLLHGFADSGLCWLRLATDLAPDYDVVMIDAPGHGQSGVGPEPARFREQSVSDVLRVIDWLGFERLALVGHSMGAATAASVALWDSRISCVVLEDPRWRDTPDEPEPVESPGIAQVRSQKALSREQLRAVANTERSLWSEMDRAYWVDAREQFNLNILQHGPISALEPWREIIPNISCPVLLVTGDPERGAFITPEVAREAMQLLPAGSLVHVRGAGHNIRRERYQPYRAAVAAFLGQAMAAC
jgi:pimeloyl-ACP methyl ester carboxylesterase